MYAVAAENTEFVVVPLGVLQVLIGALEDAMYLGDEGLELLPQQAEALRIASELVENYLVND